MAFAEKVKKSGSTVTVFLGDGTLGQGVVYESFNIAALWKLPIFFVIEANGIAQSTATALQHSGNLIDRPRSFGILTEEIQAASVVDIHQKTTELISSIRKNCLPACLLINTFRLGPHSKGDDFRDKQTIEAAKLVDPLNVMLKNCEEQVRSRAESDVQAYIQESLEKTNASPLSQKKFWQ